MLGNNADAAETYRMILGKGLPDGNFLKPVVWAEHKSCKEYFGVSLGVRAFVRSLYLYIKLSQLTKIKNGRADVKLQDVEAFRCVNRKKDYDESVKSEYKEPIRACKSCQIFFNPEAKPTAENINDFGNCAEFDVIQPAAKLNSYLNSPKVAGHWENVKEACEEQFRAFTVLSGGLEKPEDRNEMLQTYHTDTQRKVLMYVKNKTKDYELDVKDLHRH